MSDDESGENNGEGVTVDSQNLTISKVSELTTGSTSDFKEKVLEMDLNLDDLRTLREAEASGKNREEVISFLDSRLTDENVDAYLGLAENDIGELSDIVGEIDRLEDLRHFDQEEVSIDRDTLIDLVGGTVDELKDYVKDNPLTGSQVKDILNAEKKVKDRKTAKRFLKKKIKERSLGQDVDDVYEDLETLREDLEKVRDDAELDNESVSRVEDDTNEESEEGQENSEEVEEIDEGNSDKDNSGEGSDQDSNENKSEVENENDEENIDGENGSEGEVSEEQNDQTDFEKKMELAEELGLEMGEDELENFSLKDLEKIKSEKDHREHLISKLSEDDMSEEDLRNSSTSDLEKIAESIDKKEESKEEHEEMREEAEEDLEMLMGAVRLDEDENEEDDGLSTKEKIDELKNNIRSKLSRNKSGGGQSSSKINSDHVGEILDQYRELGEEEAAIKTAHIMKGFLEGSLGIEREMTYKELAETMPTEDDESMESLAEFFLKLHREQYTGKLEVGDVAETIDNCEEVIEKLS